MTLSEEEKRERKEELLMLAAVTAALVEIQPVWLKWLKTIDPNHLDIRVLEPLNHFGQAMLDLIGAIDEVARDWGYEGPTLEDRLREADGG
jgi:hypothetical protein